MDARLIAISPKPFGLGITKKLQDCKSRNDLCFKLTKFSNNIGPLPIEANQANGLPGVSVAVLVKVEGVDLSVIFIG